jgi:hypothetical protein
LRRNNVFITARRRGKRIYQFEGHNVWTDPGRVYVATMLGLNSLGPDVPLLQNVRVSRMGFGIGGNLQGTIPGAADTAYPAGADPNTTSGNEYNHLYPVEPPIGTLERPVRFSGGTNPYGTAAPSDVWLSPTDHPDFFVYQPSTNEYALKVFIRGMDGAISYSTLTEVPLSEAGLFLSNADENEPFEPAVAYVNFEPLTITDEVEAEVTWIVGIGS